MAQIIRSLLPAAGQPTVGSCRCDAKAGAARLNLRGGRACCGAGAAQRDPTRNPALDQMLTVVPFTRLMFCVLVTDGRLARAPNVAAFGPDGSVMPPTNLDRHAR
jgi:hypothetical protein